MDNRTYLRGLRVSVAYLLAVSYSAGLPADTALLLKRTTGLTDNEIAAVRRGERIVRMLDTKSQAEVAFVAITRLPIAMETYLARVRAGSLYRIGDVILQFGRYAESPSMADMASFRFESFDLRGPRADAARANKQQLLATIREYEKTGAISFGSLGEPPKPVDRTALFNPLVNQANYLRERWPAAYEYLLNYPNVANRGPEDFFIWKQMTFGFRPLTRVAQVSIWEEDRQGRREAVVLMKQIYANRYFQVSFQVDHLVSDVSDPAKPGVYLISLNQGRSDFLDGLSGKMLRPIVLSRTQSAAEKTLDQARRDFELEFGQKHQIARSRTK